MSRIPNVPEPRYLNLEYLFDQFFALLKKLFELILYLFTLLSEFRIISIIISILFAIGIGVITYKLIILRRRRKIATLMDFITEEGEPKARSMKWEEIKEKINSQNPSDWKMSILEADSILDDIFRKMGFKGDGLGERLKSVEPSDFDNLQKVWDAHKIRNKIAHEGDKFELTQPDAKSAIEGYEKALKELRYI
jgi:hypothetical protein